MVHGDPRFNPHKYKTAQNSAGGHRGLHIVCEAGYHDPKTHGIWGGGRNMGMDPYTAGGDT